MNQEWSEQNKTMQTQLKKRASFAQGMQTLFSLRKDLMQAMLFCKESLSAADFSVQPFLHATGLHNSTIAYSLWHIFRIEDIVMHTLIAGDEQIFFSGGYQQRMHAPIITTGNELTCGAIADFSAQLDIDGLYQYISEVQHSTEISLNDMPFEMLKSRIPSGRKTVLQGLHVVSEDESAAWLPDYWCGKDIRGLIQMPFSRHWIMHTEAILRIRAKIEKKRSA